MSSHKPSECLSIDIQNSEITFQHEMIDNPPPSKLFCYKLSKCQARIDLQMSASQAPISNKKRLVFQWLATQKHFEEDPQYSQFRPENLRPIVIQVV